MRVYAYFHKKMQNFGNVCVIMKDSSAIHEWQISILEIFQLLCIIVSFDDIELFTIYIHKLCESIAKIICKISPFWSNYTRRMGKYQDIRRPEHPAYRGYTVTWKSIIGPILDQSKWDSTLIFRWYINKSLSRNLHFGMC